MNIQDIQAIQLLLSTPKKIAIIPHRGPDGDAMGSTLALYHFLLKNNHYPTVISPNDFPDFLAWMPGSETVLIYEKDKENCTKILEGSEVRHQGGKRRRQQVAIGQIQNRQPEGTGGARMGASDKRGRNHGNG